jgi:hypothetical protein
MSVAGAQAQAKKLANQNHASSDAQEIGDNIKDLGRSFGDMAMRQYVRAHDAVTDSFQEAGNAVSTQPADRNRDWLPVRTCHWRAQQDNSSAFVVNSLLVRASTLMKGVAAILIPALFVTSASAATKSTSVERAPSSWESFGSKFELPHEGLNARTPIEPRLRLTDGADVSFTSDFSSLQSQQ